MEVYGLAIHQAESEHPAEFVAALAMQLPEGCRWKVAEDPDAWWTGERLLMAGLLNNLRSLIWGMADSKKRGAPPKPTGPKWAVKGKSRSLAMTAMSREELVLELSKPRKEAADG